MSLSLSFEEDSDFWASVSSGLLCVIFLQLIWLLCNLFYD